jgi:predicted CoA-binding protein
MPDITPDDARKRALLTSAQTIAVVGHSDKPSRTSYQIAQFLRQAGYRVYAVNPTVTKIGQDPCYATLADVPEIIDIVNVFRRSECLLDVVQAAIAIHAKTVWAQVGVSDPQVAQGAIATKINLVMDRCIRTEIQRLEVVRSGR